MAKTDIDRIKDQMFLRYAKTKDMPRNFYGKYQVLEDSMHRFFGPDDQTPSPVFTPSQIFEVQLAEVEEQLKQNAGIKNAQQIVKSLNAELDYLNMQDDLSIDQIISNIELQYNNILQNYDFSGDITDNSSDEEIIQAYQQMVKNLEQLDSSLTALYQTLIQKGMLSESDLNLLRQYENRYIQLIQALENFENGVKDKILVRDYKNKTYSRKDNRIQVTYGTKLLTKKGQWGSLKGYLNNEKGQLGELLGVNKLRKHLMKINPGKKLKVVQLGNIQGTIYGVNAQKMDVAQLTSDIGIFDLDNIAKDFEITISVNGVVQQITLLQFIENLEKHKYDFTETIILSDNYADYMVGVQAKMGKNQNIFNKGLRTKIAVSELDSDMGNFLKLMTQAFQSANSQKTGVDFISRHEDYTAMFNYSLASRLIYLLGKDNLYVLTRDGFYYIGDYIRTHSIYFGTGLYLMSHGIDYKYQITQLKK